MQDDITDYQVAQAAAAFVLSLLQFLYAWREPITSLFRSVNNDRATWRLWPDPFQCSCCLVGLCVGIPLAVLFGLARGGRLAHTLEFFLAWKGMPILSTEIFLVRRSSPVALG
jgi:hypothetical protein